MANKTLSRKQARQVEDWVADNHKSLTESRYSLEKCARQAQVALGFPVSRSSIKTSLDVLGLPAPIPHGGGRLGDGGGELEARVARLERVVAFMLSDLSYPGTSAAGEELQKDMEELSDGVNNHPVEKR